jgi:hypothetical protein
MAALWRLGLHVDLASRKVKGASERIRLDALAARQIDRASRECEEPPLQTIQEGR